MATLKEKEEMTTEKDSTQKEESLMLEVVSLQGLSGQWKLCTKLSKMMNIPESCLREKDIVQEEDELVTLVVITWLRRNFAHRHDEWELIETKALQWLANCQLNSSVEELLEKVENKYWKASK